MGWKAVGALTAILWTVPSASLAQTVVVRTFDNYGVAGDALAVARPMVDAAFAAAGIHLSWLDCWSRDREAAQAPSECRQPLKANEVVLRLQAAGALPASRHLSMGFALVNVADGVPFLATVFPDRVRSVSRDARLDFGVLLGRAIAHEIGHLLLGTNHHTDGGLMRAGWSHVEFRQNADADWAFGTSEIAAIKASAATRSGQ